MDKKVIPLRPIKESAADYEKIEARIKSAFKEVLYEPLIRELNLATTPAATKLLEAIQTGRVTFSRGTFRGRFNASVTKELRGLGAEFDLKTGTFKLLQRELPYELRTAVAASESRFQERLARIDRKISQNLPEEIAGSIKVTELFDSTLYKVDRDFKKTLSHITVPPDLTPERRKRIAEEWQENLDIWIKDFAVEEILKLRKAIQKSAFAGNRYESMVKSIQRSYGVTESKAKFLARQETGLLMAKFKETRYVDAGVNEYIWKCVAGSKNHPVRPRHKSLENKIFRWDNPPITTAPDEPARRNNPGQDFNCRCFAVPIVRFKP